MADQLEPVLVVIPTYNERDNIESIVTRLHAALPKAHVLVVDDGSPDGTGDIADELAKNDADGRVHVMHRTEKNGLGAAYVAGFRWGLDRDYAVLVRDGRRRLARAGGPAADAGRADRRRPRRSAPGTCPAARS